MPEVRYYSSFDEDFEQTADQDCRIPQNYKWVYNSPADRLAYKILIPVFRLFSKLYLNGWHHVRVMNPEVLPQDGSTGILYLNHSQPVMDPFLPGVILKPPKFRSICSPSNLGIPVLGRLLPLLGAVPVASSLREMRQMKEALHQAVNRNEWIVIYPEKHVWPWCTFLRPFDDTSFQFCLDYDKPAWCGVLCPKEQSGRRPVFEVWLAGPFHAESGLPRRKARRQLYEQVKAEMTKLEQHADCRKVEYVYKKRTPQNDDECA